MPAIGEAWTPAGLFVFSNRGIGVPWFQGGTGLQLAATVLAAVLAWWLVSRWRKRVFDRTGNPSRAGLYGSIVFLAIVVAGWFALGFSVSLPEVVGRQVRGGIRVDPAYMALLIALVLYTASHIAEITRGSIQAVPRGQEEAATAVALSPFQRLWNVVLPQAMRIAIPPLGNQYLNLIKNSSLGAGISYFELTMVTRIAGGQRVACDSRLTVALGCTYLAGHLGRGEPGQPSVQAGGAMTATTRPVRTTTPARWLRKNLFRTPLDSVLTLILAP